MTITQLDQHQNTTSNSKDDVILEVKNLKKHFPIKEGVLQRTKAYTKAVDGLSFSIKKGETLGVVGESGCGKSTAGRTIIRLYEPTEGKIIFKGMDITHSSERELRKIMRKDMQMIYQDPFASLNPRKTLKKMLMEPLNTHSMYSGVKERTEVVESILETVGLDISYVNRYPHEFSGGQRQRIGIARSLVLQPNLLIADEAVSALDVSIQSQIINLLEKLQEELQLTYIFISHDLSVVRHISDRVAVMYLGKIMELANKIDLYEEPLHPYTQALLSAVPMQRKHGTKKRERIVLKGELPSASNPPKGCVFHTRCPMAMDVCKEIPPTNKEVKTDHFVACHLYE